MTFSTAPALLVGVGARILLDKITRAEPPSIRDFILIGLWQGVALQHTFKHYTSLLPPLAFGVITKLFAEYTTSHDIFQCTTTSLGIVLGFLFTDLLSHFIDSPRDHHGKHSRTKPHLANSNLTHQRQRTVQFQKNDLPSASRGDSSRRRNNNTLAHTISDITSVDSDSELISSHPITSPLDKEIAALRTRASLADSERRRFREERKWAISQGNLARASQMKSQVKHYTELMNLCHREADAKVIQAAAQSQSQPRTRPIVQPVPFSFPEEPSSNSSASRERPHRKTRVSSANLDRKRAVPMISLREPGG